MKKISRIFLFILSAALTFGFAIYNFSVSQAQTNQRERQVSATPTPKTSATPPGIRDLPPPPPLPIEDDTPIKIDVELVNLNVRVVDRNNRPISNLRKGDFTIYEDNVLQTIDDFSKGEVPTNYSLVIDNSGSLRSQLEKVIEAGKILIGTNRRDDETSIIRFVSSEKIEIVQDFTPSKADLNDALENLYIEGGPTAIIDAIYLAAERVDRYERTSGGDHKRRALVLVSDGEDRSSYYKEQQLFDLLRESEVQIYAIGFINELESGGGFISKSARGKAKAFLERLAKETGGKVYFPNSVSELNSIAQDIASELRTQYSITYYPTNDNKDGSFRNIKVVVADGPNKEKRIAVTRSGRTAGRDGSPTPTLQTPNKRTQ
ncbi:MAG TPA: VWA domain-containing protein [Pyrinomonadaceae bacterium]|nr:VWA domain-containing protein [Pyrinomonadaceae bacterium]